MELPFNREMGEEGGGTVLGGWAVAWVDKMVERQVRVWWDVVDDRDDSMRFDSSIQVIFLNLQSQSSSWTDADLQVTKV